MRKQILSLVLVALFSVVSFVAKAQLSIAALATDYTISFDATVDGVNDGVYAGTGFLATPGSGQLDADAWAVSGMSDGEKPFGTENTTGDFGRGTSMSNTSGGLYAYEVEAGNFAFGMLPAGTDITPGYIGLKVTNNTGSNANVFDFSYDLWVFNNAARSQFFNGEYSLDGSTWTPIAALAFATPLAADATPAWVKTSLTATISENITNGATLYVRWYTDDNGGTGTRDKIAFDNVKIQMRGASYVDWCNIQSPDVLTIAQGSTGTVYGQVLKTGVTEAAGQGADITGYVYYSED
ncbi:MAG TPA: hypothetical protein PLA77_10635, partial [Bacteroidales bacterium]|nr:hypothetical protein [Bacteroidales bacterium]